MAKWLALEDRIKFTDFTLVTEKQLQLVLHQINHLPRKIHVGQLMKYFMA